MKLNPIKFSHLKSLSILLSPTFLFGMNALAVEFEPLNQAISKSLGTTKAFKKEIKIDGEDVTTYYSKSADDKPSKFAVIQKGIYAPSCTHTWVVGLDAKKGTVDQIRVVEMSCQHAFPAKAPEYLAQYTGKGFADLEKLDSQVAPIAKATGSCLLTTKAVKKSIRLAREFK